MDRRENLKSSLDAYQTRVNKTLQKEADIQRDIQRAVDVKGECPDRFICPICCLLTYKPIACQECEKFFCRKCID